jgi:hypothetical protein
MTSPSCDSEEGSGHKPDAVKHFFFAGLELGGPIEELRAVFEKKVRTYEGLGDRENAERCVRAFELARSRMEAAMRQRSGSVRS